MLPTPGINPLRALGRVFSAYARFDVLAAEDRRRNAIHRSTPFNLRMMLNSARAEVLFRQQELASALGG